MVLLLWGILLMRFALLMWGRDREALWKRSCVDGVAEITLIHLITRSAKWFMQWEAKQKCGALCSEPIKDAETVISDIKAHLGPCKQKILCNSGLQTPQSGPGFHTQKKPPFKINCNLSFSCAHSHPLEPLCIEFVTRLQIVKLFKGPSFFKRSFLGWPNYYFSKPKAFLA